MLRSVARSKGTWVAMLAALGLVLTVLLLTSPGSHPKPAQAQTTQDPLAVGKASLVVDGIEIASFNELPAGITSSIKLPRAEGTAAHLEPLRIALKRPATGGLEMSAWHRTATTHTTGYKKNVTLIFYNTEGTPIARFKLNNAWPSEYHLDAQKAGSSSLLYERVTMTASSFERVSPN
jgi:phage tail-like protein